jgi:hypothetical protein
MADHGDHGAHKPKWAELLDTDYKDIKYSEIEKKAKEIHEKVESLEERADHAMALLRAAGDKQADFMDEKKQSIQDATSSIEGIDKIMEDLEKVGLIPDSKFIDTQNTQLYGAKIARALMTSLSKNEDLKGMFGAPEENDDYLLKRLDIYFTGAVGMQYKGQKLSKAEEVSGTFYSLIRQKKGKEAMKFLKDALAQYHASTEASRFMKYLVPIDHIKWRVSLASKIADHLMVAEGVDLKHDYASIATDYREAMQIFGAFQGANYAAMKEIKVEPDATKGPEGKYLGKGGDSHSH